MPLLLALFAIVADFYSAFLGFRLARRTGRKWTWLPLSFVLCLIGVVISLSVVQQGSTETLMLTLPNAGIIFVLSLLLSGVLWKLGAIVNGSHPPAVSHEADSQTRPNQTNADADPKGDAESWILDNTVEIIAHYDAHHNIRWANAAYMKATGKSLAELQNSRCYEAWGRTDVCESCPLSKVLETGLSHTAELCPEIPDHQSLSRTCWLIRLSPIHDDSGNVTGVIEIAHDITDRKRTEKELQRSNQVLEETAHQLRDTHRQLIDQQRQRALTTMASGIAHNFNNSLSPIQGFTSMLIENPELLEDRDETLRYLGHIQKAASTAAETVRLMRKFYRPQEQESFSCIDINDVISEAVSVTKPQWKEEAEALGKEINIQTDLTDGATVQGNEAELHEIITNLIFNAVDAMPEGGIIHIRTRNDGNHVILDVSDQGIGMSEETKRKCLDPFYTTKGSEGSGLGLASIQGNVERHNGKLTIESTEGEGTIFRICLPREQHSAESVRTPETNHIPQELKVLIAEDEKPQRELLKKMLETDGHTVETASDGAEALEKFGNGSFQLIIVDRAMPEMNGDKLAAEIKEVSPDKPVIMLTGFGDTMDAADEKPDGVDHLISKPITRDKLRHSLSKVMGANTQESAEFAAEQDTAADDNSRLN